MKPSFIIALVLLLASCTSNLVTVNDASAWSSFAYEGFGNKISRLAGNEAIDCGVINQINTNDPTNKNNSLKKARSCIEKSGSNGLPFKFGTVRIPIDSYLFEAITFTPAKEYWIVHYDYMVDGSSNMHVIKRCKGLDLKRSDSTFTGINCIEVSTTDWLSDIPEQQN